MPKPVKYLSFTPLLLALIILGGYIVRLQGIEGIIPNPDELMHVGIAHASSLLEMWQRSLLEAHPPLGHFIRYFTFPLGDGVLSERYISLTLGLLTIPFFFLIGREVAGEKAGLLMAFFCSFAPITVSISQEVRNYSLFLCLLSFAFYSYLRYRNTSRTAWLAVYSLFLSLACLTHFSGYLFAAIVGIDHAWRTRRHLHQWPPFMAACMPLIVLATLSYHYFYAEGRSIPQWRAYCLETKIDSYLPSTPQAILENIIAYVDILKIYEIGLWISDSETFLDADASLRPTMNALGVFIMGFWYVVAIRAAIRNRPDMTSLLLPQWIFATTLAFLFIYPFTPMRHCIYMLPIFLLPLAMHAGGGGATLTHRQFVVCTTGIVLFTTLCIFIGRDRVGTWDRSAEHHVYAQAMRTVEAIVPPGEPIIINRFTSLYIDHDIDQLRYGYDFAGDLRVQRAHNAAFVSDPRRYHWTYTPENLKQVIARTLASYPKAGAIWFMSLHAYMQDTRALYLCLMRKKAVISYKPWNGIMLLSASSQALQAWRNDPLYCSKE